MRRDLTSLTSLTSLTMSFTVMLELLCFLQYAYKERGDGTEKLSLGVKLINIIVIFGNQCIACMKFRNKG